jgi:predicted ATPase
MRLIELRLPKFKNLRDFRIEFSQSTACVMVGPNGTGKSNVLEALVLIFRDLDLGRAPSIDCELTYECRGRLIEVNVDSSRARGRALIKVNGKRTPLAQISRKAGGEYLPEYLFGYYSGPSNRLEEHFAEHQQRFSYELLHGNDQPLRPLLYARQVHSQFVLMAFFASASPPPTVVRDFLSIESFDSVLFVLRKPYWADGHRTVDAGDSRFWGARGVVASFLNRLNELCLAPLSAVYGAEDRRYLFLPDAESLRQLAAGYGSQAEFFKALESLYISDLIEDVRTRVRVRGADHSLTFREMSEGEQQLLTVTGLLQFVGEAEGLVLLDEPDTHLNPAWSMRYLELLHHHVADQSATQIVMSTHDPLVVSGLTRDSVRVMRRTDEGGVAATMPVVHPRGMGVAGLLTSEIYGLRSQLDSTTLRWLDQKRSLAAADQLSPQQADQLDKLNEALGSVDFAEVSRDPLYKPYVDAMSALEPELGLRKLTLTPEDIAVRSDLARRIVERLLRELTVG